GVGVKELGPVPDNSAELLGRAGQKAGHILEGEKGDVESVAEAHEAGALHRRIDVEAAGQVRRLIGHYSDRSAIHAGEADHDVPGEVLVRFEELAVLDHA